MGGERGAVVVGGGSVMPTEVVGTEDMVCGETLEPEHEGEREREGERNHTTAWLCTYYITYHTSIKDTSPGAV